MKQVIVFPRGQLTPKDKERLSKNGVVAVEADHPHLVVTVIPGASVVAGDDLLMAALTGIGDDLYAAKRFTVAIHARLKAREEQAANA